MFGTWRLLLALGVVLAHLGSGTYIGRFSVFAFYGISGYLMCLVLDRRYGFSARGFGGFALNRFLRIFPPYWAGCALSVALLAWFGNPGFGVLWYPWSMPDTAAEWLANLSIFGLETGSANRLIAPAWALRVELFYYLALGLGLGRGRAVALVWAVASVGWHVWLAVAGASWDERYYPIPAASLPFSLGACAYHLRPAIQRRLARPLPWLALVSALWVGNVVYVALARQAGRPMPFYVACALSAAMVVLLSLPLGASERVRRLDARLGDMSYPVYLVHMQVGFLLASLTSLPHHGMRLFAFGLPAVIVAGWLLLRLVDDPVEALRARVRDRHDESG